MDRWTDRSPSETTPLPAGSSRSRPVVVSPGVSFSIVTEATPLDPLSRDLASGLFPSLCRPLVQLIESIVPRGGRILDLGAHVGTFALAAAASGREVVAVEASPRNAELLAASREINRFEHLRVVNAAVSDGPGSVLFLQYGPFGHVAPPGNQAPGVSVRAIAVDDLLAEVGWDRVDFIKMDIEGSEVAGLIGLAGLLTRPDAPPLFVESNGHTLHLYGETPAGLKAALAAYGYRLFQVEDRRLIPVAHDEYQGSTVVDYLAIKAEPRPPTAWRLDPPMREREHVRRVRAACLSPSLDERYYVARTIGQAPDPVRNDWRVVKAVNGLKRDGDPAVRSAASAWSFTATPQPWYAFWRR